MNCNCLSQIEQELAKAGLQLSDRHKKFRVDRDTLKMSLTLALLTESADGKRRTTPCLFVSYCPFCGAEATSKPRSDLAEADE